MSQQLQHLILLDNVSTVGAGSAFDWDGGPAIVFAWAVSSLITDGVLRLQVSPNGTDWMTVGNEPVGPRTAGFKLAQQSSASEGFSSGNVAMSSINLPPMKVRAIVANTAPSGLTVVMQGYDDALQVPNNRQ